MGRNNSFIFHILLQHLPHILVHTIDHVRQRSKVHKVPKVGTGCHIVVLHDQPGTASTRCRIRYRDRTLTVTIIRCYSYRDSDVVPAATSVNGTGQELIIP